MWAKLSRSRATSNGPASLRRRRQLTHLGTLTSALPDPVNCCTLDRGGICMRSLLQVARQDIRQVTDFYWATADGHRKIVARHHKLAMIERWPPQIR
jgi:hypothetical protein